MSGNTSSTFLSRFRRRNHAQLLHQAHVAPRNQSSTILALARQEIETPDCFVNGAAAFANTSWQRHKAKLLQQAQLILVEPIFHNLAIFDALDGYSADCNLLASWRIPLQVASVRSSALSPGGSSSANRIIGLVICTPYSVIFWTS